MKQEELNKKLEILVQEALTEIPAILVVGTLNATAFHILYYTEGFIEKQT